MTNLTENFEPLINLLYMYDVAGMYDRQASIVSLRNFACDEPTTEKAIETFEELLNSIDKIDELITCSAKNWSFSRLDRPDRSVLRLGVFWLLRDEVEPVVVARVEKLSEQYLSSESKRFAKGVLSAVAKKIKREREK